MIDEQKYPILSKVDYPSDIRQLSLPQLKQLCTDIREYMVDTISEIGGHFGGGLGTVELTVAIHKVFNTPHDLVVWDTGHQAYPHKILTGRKEALNRIRQFGGISGFLKRSESEYDTFGAGHASTSISAALGMATAKNITKVDKKVVAVIGDGAMTGGMAYEAMNNSGVLKTDLIVVLNDNNMSIAPNVWQISNYFTEMISHPDYNKFKGQIWDLTGKLDQFGDRMRRVAVRLEQGIKLSSPRECFSKHWVLDISDLLMDTICIRLSKYLNRLKISKDQFSSMSSPKREKDISLPRVIHKDFMHQLLSIS